MKTATPFVSCLALVFTSLVLVTVGMPLAIIARPRPPLPPLPEFAPLLSRAGFDEPFWARTVKAEAFHPAYTDLVESWSGYALRRAGNAVTPFLVPAVDEFGPTNVNSSAGAVRFWFRPYWSSGEGPGVVARLVELSAVGQSDAVSAWSLLVSPDGSVLSLAGPEGALLRTEINWRADEWHLVALNYGPGRTALFIDGALMAEGDGTLAVPPPVAAFSVGSTVAGADPAGGEFDEFCVFAGSLSEAAVGFCHQLYAPTAARGPISAEEEAAQRAAAAKRRAERAAAGESGGAQMRLLGPTSTCLTNVPAHLTNIVAVSTNTGWTVTFDIQGGTNGLLYDIFTTPHLTGNSITNSPWTWLERGPTCSRYQYTNQPPAYAFYVLGTPQDSDNDGLTDAYEQLVSKTNPTNANSPRAIYEDVISNQNPSNWFKLNDGSLTNAISGGPVTTLTNGGGFWDVDAFATGSNAFAFNVNTQRLVVGDVINGGDGTKQGSLSLLFRSLNGYPTSTPRYLFCQRGNATNEFSMFFEGTNSSPGSFKVQMAGQTKVIVQSNDVVFGTWYYLAMTWNESNHLATWYLAPIGGTLSSGTIDLGVTNVVGNSTNVNLGNRDTQNRAISSPGNGALDEIAFWNRELTVSEVNAQFDTLKVLFQGPAKVFDLSRWELTLPVDNLNQLDNTHDPLDISTGWLKTGFKYVDPADGTQKYFYRSGDNQMVFAAPWNGADQDANSPATSLGSPRSELRETLANGGEHNWAANSEGGIHTLQASCKVISGTNKVIIGQIHAKTPIPTNGTGAVPAVILSHNPSNGVVTVTVKHNPYDKDADARHDFLTPVPLGETINYTLQMVGFGTIVALNVTVNGEQPLAIPMTQSPYEWRP